jgi:tetratricopeptide (TPR) repeat protein
VSTRQTSPLLLALLIGILAPPAGAQVRAPTLVGEGEPEPAEEPSPAPPPPRVRERPRAQDEVPLPPVPAPARAAPPVPPPALPREARSPESAAAPARALPATPADLPPPPPPPTATVDLARKIVPVQASWSRIAERWQERRTALREQDPARTTAAEGAILEAKRDLAIENLFMHAASEVRESRRALEANLPGEALARAEFAARLAPDYPDAHLAVARARLARPPREFGRIFAALGAAGGAALRDPYTTRAFLADLLGATLAALFAASALTILLLFVRCVRLFLHDFHHLPLLRGTAPTQTGFLALVLLSLPLAFGLGPAVGLAVLLLSAWLYLRTAERVVATIALAALVLLPHAAGRAARMAAWTGSSGEVVHLLEHGAVSDEEAAEIVARVSETPGSPALYAALGRHAKRRGDLEGALRWYAAADPDGREAEIRVNVGNVLFLKGDLEGARAAYLAATDRAGSDLTTLAAAHFNLSRLYLRTADVERSAAALDKAQQVDGELVQAMGPGEDDLSANSYLADLPVPAAKISALVASDGSAEAVREALVARLGGALPRDLWPWVPGVAIALLWLLALVAGRIDPAHACERCGRPACRRCDGLAGSLCGQCVNVFQKRGVVDSRDRLRKEAQVRRHERGERFVFRALAILGGGAGHVFGGAPGRGFALIVGLSFAWFVIWFWRGVLPPPQPSAYAFAGKLLVAIPLAVAIYAFAIRDAFRRTGG